MEIQFFFKHVIFSHLADAFIQSNFFLNKKTY